MLKAAFIPVFLLTAVPNIRGNKVFNLTPTETFDGGLGIQTIKGIKTETQKIVYEFDVPARFFSDSDLK